MNEESLLLTELEILRRESVKVFAGDPMEIPCIETSDAEKLCKHPVVSVNMLTYNHEPYIGRAIEGVMMQKTDFEVELVIGDDCSTDRTREICFEYQRRHPDKIRVLWWKENLYRNPHPAGGNGARNKARCRGELIAFCEGDDYWTDPLKLQKQVDAMRAHNAVFCVARCEWRYLDGRVRIDQENEPEARIIPAEYFIKHYFHTTTYLVHAETYRECCRRYAKIPFWHDFIMSQCMATMGTVYYIPDCVSVYNWRGTGLGEGLATIGRRTLLLTHRLCLAYEGPETFRDRYAAEFIQTAFARIMWGISDNSFSHLLRRNLDLLRIMLSLAKNKKTGFSRLHVIAIFIAKSMKMFFVVLYCRSRFLMRAKRICFPRMKGIKGASQDSMR